MIALVIVITLPFLSIVLAVAAATTILATVGARLVASAPLLLLLPALAAPAVAAERHWVPPVHGAPAKRFHLGPNPFLRGQHRGVDFAARGPVRAACSGRVVFAGRVAREGTVSVRCGRWRVSYAPLVQVAVREGQRVGAGARLGRSAGGIHFGVRREGRRFGYVDPLRFFASERSAPPVLGPPPVRPPASPRARAPDLPRSLPARPHAASRAAPTLAPWPVWLGLTLLLTGLLGAGRLRLPRGGSAAAARHAPRPAA